MPAFFKFKVNNGRAHNGVVYFFAVIGSAIEIFGKSEAFYKVAQAISETLPPDNKEKSSPNIDLINDVE
ncbi:MAG TPA: hypothetical protein VK186_10580 [Candidatus Deferrimicrobium sp.]|nr:hypothetical protein [Candidatus Deferrimicrobium sp.]